MLPSRRAWVSRLVAWIITPSLHRLEREASEYGRLTLQQTELENGLGWHCSLRTHPGKGPRYAWTGFGDTIPHAIESVLTEARGNPMTPIKATRGHAPKLGGAEFDLE